MPSKLLKKLKQAAATQMYKVRIARKDQKKLAKISEPHYSRIKTAILRLANNPRPQGYKKLKGRDALRIRVGDYRIIYEIHDDMCYR